MINSIIFIICKNNNYEYPYIIIKEKDNSNNFLNDILKIGLGSFFPIIYFKKEDIQNYLKKEKFTEKIKDFYENIKNLILKKEENSIFKKEDLSKKSEFNDKEEITTKSQFYDSKSQEEYFKIIKIKEIERFVLYQLNEIKSGFDTNKKINYDQIKTLTDNMKKKYNIYSDNLEEFQKILDLLKGKFDKSKVIEKINSLICKIN